MAAIGLAIYFLLIVLDRVTVGRRLNVLTMDVSPSLALLWLLLGSASCTRLNVLFLVADDMRPELGCFLGPEFPSPVHPEVHTPHLDALAARSLLLKKAYVQQAVCSPSRTSLLTGRRPDTTHVYDLVHYWRNVGGNFTTIPQYFKQNGYASVGMGKIFHPGRASDFDDPISWSEEYYHAPNERYYYNTKVSWNAVTDEEREEYQLPEDQIRSHAVEKLESLAEKAITGERPFFLAAGFHKPHLPFVFPKHYLDYYPLDNISLPDNPYAPAHMPTVAWSDWSELRRFHDIRKLNASGAINTTLPDSVVRDLRRAYYSALSYTDYKVGELLKTLKDLKLENSTIVSFWGDHGWQLGEHGEWCKHTNFELATHAPMMIHIPGLTDQGIVTEQLTEFVDLFPTLVEAAGLPELPLCPETNSTEVPLCREGASLMPLIKDPKTPKWKKAAFSQYPREDYTIMGYSMRTAHYRYTEWAKFEGKPVWKPDWNELAGVELYDHSVDPEENINYADDSKYAKIRSELSDMLHKGWRNQITDPQRDHSLRFKPWKNLINEKHAIYNWN